MHGTIEEDSSDIIHSSGTAANVILLLGFSVRTNHPYFHEPSNL